MVKKGEKKNLLKIAHGVCSFLSTEIQCLINGWGGTITYNDPNPIKTIQKTLKINQKQHQIRSRSTSILSPVTAFSSSIAASDLAAAKQIDRFLPIAAAAAA